MPYWALASHPDHFRVLDAVLEQDEEWWRTGGRPLAKGDRVAIWKYKGRDAFRGVIAFGVILTDPAEMELHDEFDPYWVGLHVEPLPALAPRVRVAYVHAPLLPLWMGATPGSVVNELSVSRTQGGTAFHIQEDQWARLLDEAGGWPSASPEATTESRTIEDAVRGRSRGQGFGLDASQRRVVEKHAMAVVEEAYRSMRWDVTDVSATSPYDLLCERGDERRRVEVKGTTGGAESVLLTRNEVVAARANSTTAALAVVHHIQLLKSLGDVAASGGELVLIDPWDIDRGTLSPFAYQYRLP